MVISWDEDLFIDVIPVLVKLGVVKSNSEMRRLVAQGGVKKNGEILADLNDVLVNGDVLKIGKKQFFKIVK